MGRNKVNLEKKKKVLTINIELELYKRLEKLSIKNKSKFFDWLLKEHFNQLKNGGNE